MRKRGNLSSEFNYVPFPTPIQDYHHRLLHYTNHGKGNLLILSFLEISLQKKIDKDNAQKLRTDNPPIQSQGRRNKYSLHWINHRSVNRIHKFQDPGFRRK